MVRAFFEMANAGSGQYRHHFAFRRYIRGYDYYGRRFDCGIIAMFAYNYLVTLVDGVVNKMEAKTMAFMDLLNEPANHNWQKWD